MTAPRAKDRGVKWPRPAALATAALGALAMGALGAALALPGPAAAGPAQAGPAPVVLDGPAIQGGLLVGRTAPGATLRLDGRPVKVAADGRFVIGFGRDAGPQATIEVDLAGAERRQRVLAVTQRHYQVQRIDGLPPAEVSPGPEALKRIRRESDLIKETRRRASQTPLFESPFTWPVTGILSGVYGSRRILNGEPRAPHLGVDIAAPEGTPVVAPSEGVVALVQGDMFFTGKTVMLDHGHGLTSVYAHMSTIAVHEGDRVAPGTRIGSVGMSGRATGPHLHWGVHLKGVGLDPALLAGDIPPPPRAHRLDEAPASSGPPHTPPP